jgi:hypothetical protein
MILLDNAIDRIFEKSTLSDNEDDRILYKSIYYHLCDYKDILEKCNNLTSEINQLSNRWELVKRTEAIEEKLKNDGKIK